MKFDQDLCLDLQYDSGKMNSTLGSVVPLAMFYKMDPVFFSIKSTQIGAFYQYGYTDITSNRDPWKAVLEMRSQIWDLVPIGTKALEWCQISPISARESQISSVWEDAKLSPIYPHLTNKVPKKYQISPL